jgi:isocitrate/isopropylmalate dehydrogenase
MILSCAMMLRHVGEHGAASAIEGAVDAVLGEGKVRTRDLGGEASTTEMAEAVAAALRA